MSFFCCLPSPRKQERILDEKSANDPLPAYDFAADEGADYQQRLWQKVIDEKTESVTVISRQVHGNVLGADVSTPEAYLQSLTAAYNENGFAQRMPRVREVFASIEPFTQAIATMAQGNSICSLLWGTLMLVFQSVLRAAQFWDNTRQMFADLAKQLPRFHAYTNILHTPRLHESLRTVYVVFVDFCIKVVEVLHSPQLCAILRLQWTPLAAEYSSASSELKQATFDFKEEVHLAHMQDREKKHSEVMRALSASEIGGFKTNITLPRNLKFTGRDGILALLQSMLEPSYLGRPDDLAARSVLIHATGGMGKTETALEYTYRYRKSYSCIFWLRAQSRSILVDSFLGAIELLGIAPDHLSTTRKLQIGLEWFQSNKQPWLLIFDNAEDLGTVREFWPAATQGAIIITSQNPEFRAMTTSHIHLQPMPAEEGSALIQTYLNRGGSEKEAALKLATSLGGHPLAIVHFTGYIARSQAPIAQIAASFDQRLRSSQIWQAQDLSADARAYEYTLATVWDLAIRRLSDDARKLLEFIAFLDPDQISTSLFIGDGAKSAAGWQYWDVDRFNAAVSILCERHLVERYTQESFDSLRTHRALQRSVLQGLDEESEHRDAVFAETTSIIRKELPVFNYVKRSDGSQFPIFARCLPHIVALHRNFLESAPPIKANLEFADVLLDAGVYGAVEANSTLCLPLLRTGKQVCETLTEIVGLEKELIYCDIISAMNQSLQPRGMAGRAEAMQLVLRIRQLRDSQMQDIPRDRWTTLQVVSFGRSVVDLGCNYVQANMISEGRASFERGIELYAQHGDALKVRLYHARSLHVRTLAIMQEKEQTREQIAATTAVIESELGRTNRLTLQTKSYAGHALFSIGDLKASGELHKEVFEQHLQLDGNTHHQTLGSQYCFAVCLQRGGLLEEARQQLLDILETGVVTETWRLEDVERTKFRLYVVEREMGNLEKAHGLFAQVQPRVSELRKSEKHLRILGDVRADREFTDADDMALLDANVCSWHGRTAGIWSPGGGVW